MNKIVQIAQREFLATVLTKGFLIGILAVPVLTFAMILILPLLINQKTPKISGEIAILDRSGVLFERVAPQLTADAFAQRRRASEERLHAIMPAAVRELAQSPAAESAVQQGLQQALGEAPELQLVLIDTAADIEAEKRALLDGPRLVLVVVHANAVQQDPALPASAKLGSYDLFVRAKLDDRLLDQLRDALKLALVDARLAARQIDAAQIRSLTRTPFVAPLVIDADGERRSNEAFNRVLPILFMALILATVMTAGQQLMTSTIEEKSSRVVEVLLAAVSPTELMAGKILGQLGVASLLIGLYGGLGLLALISFSLVGLVDPWMLLYLPIFFLIAFVVLASLMAAIGAAVNELREAQALLTPVILVVTLPMMLWLPISRDPNSMLATVLSLTPPVNPFVMILRLSSNTPPPLWQVWLSIAIGIGSMFAAIWFAGKVFRIGLLMHGKPPNLMTLARWVRQA